MSLRIGLTGGIGSGKSMVAQLFSSLGIPVYNADKAAKELQNTDQEVKKQLIHFFGEALYSDGILNRGYLSAIVFSNPDKLAALNAIMHPATLQAAAIWMQQQTAPYILKEAALIFEAHAENQLDYIIGVSAPEDIRIKRTILRDHSTAEQVKQRMQFQMDEATKMKRCDFILINDEKQLLIPQVLALHQLLLERSKQQTYTSLEV
jgi:dephospho-CoA kinase